MTPRIRAGIDGGSAGPPFPGWDVRSDSAESKSLQRPGCAVRSFFSIHRFRDVVAELNRYRAGRIVILDSSLNDLTVSGVFATDNPDAGLDGNCQYASGSRSRGWRSFS